MNFARPIAVLVSVESVTVLSGAREIERQRDRESRCVCVERERERERERESSLSLPLCSSIDTVDVFEVQF
jgi:hypothetical protein